MRRLAHGDRLFRRLQRAEIHPRPQRLRPTDRQPPADGPVHLLGRLLPAAVLHPAVQDQHPAHHDPVGNVRPGAGLRRQRPGELHRRARRRIRRLPIARETGDTQMLMGALSENVPANFLILLAAGVLMILTLWTSKGHARLRNRTFALGAGRRRPAAIRLVGLFADDRPRGPSTSAPASSEWSPSTCGGDLAPFRIRGCRTQRRTLRHDPRHGQPHDLGPADRHSHVTQTPAFDHLRLLHGGDGFVARRPCLGPRKRRVPHFGRHDRRGRMVRHGAGRIPHRFHRGAGADLRRNAGLHRHHAALRLDARPRNFLKRTRRATSSRSRPRPKRTSSPTCATRYAARWSAPRRSTTAR